MRALALALVLSAAASAVGFAAEWDAIRPGESTQDTVRAQFGSPTKVSSEKIEGYDSAQWLYEGDQAPRGMIRATVDFGLLTPQGYKPELVRQMLLEPRPGIFTRRAIITGWGLPDRTDKDGGIDVFKYRSGLWIYFNNEGWLAERMYFFFVSPQPASPPQR